MATVDVDGPFGLLSMTGPGPMDSREAQILRDSLAVWPSAMDWLLDSAISELEHAPGLSAGPVPVIRVYLRGIAAVWLECDRMRRRLDRGLPVGGRCVVKAQCALEAGGRVRESLACCGVAPWCDGAAHEEAMCALADDLGVLAGRMPGFIDLEGM